MQITINFNQSIDNDVLRILGSLFYIENHFYVKNNFHVVSKRFIGDKTTVVLPEISFEEYSKLQKPLEEELIINSDIRKFTKSILILKKIINNKGIETDLKNFKSLKNNWMKINERFFDYLFDIFDLPYKSLDIKVNVSPYSTAFSFILEKVSVYKAKLHLQVRDDMSIYEIADAIVSALFYKKLSKKGLYWCENISILDFIVKETKINRIIPPKDSILESVRSTKVDKQLIKHSRDFLKKLGYQFAQELKVVENNVYIEGQEIPYHFTPTETKLLNFFLERRKTICTYFDIGAVLWDDPDNFSIWAISQIIHKLRFKLKKAGFPGDKLKTYRGKGFILDM